MLSNYKKLAEADLKNFRKFLNMLVDNLDNETDLNYLISMCQQKLKLLENSANEVTQFSVRPENIKRLGELNQNNSEEE